MIDVQIGSNHPQSLDSEIERVEALLDAASYDDAIQLRLVLRDLLALERLIERVSENESIVGFEYRRD